MGKLTVAFLQLTPTGSLDGNQAKGLEACREAARQGADIALFPEMWSNGYDIYRRPVSAWVADAIPGDGPFITAFQKAARELGMAICLTYLEQHEGGPRNSLVLFDRRGQRVLDYAKVHTCDFDVERNLTPGDGFRTASLDTASGPIQVGAMICYDREAPESARILMLQGSELVLVPNACPMEVNRLSQLRARAYENMFAIATCNYPSAVPDCNGHSTLFDGVAYLPDDGASRDMCLFEADEKEGVHLCTFDLELLRGYRRSECQGNTYRHPRKYGLLTEEVVREPFIRPDYRP